MRGTDQGGGVCRKTYLRDSIREEGLLERERERGFLEREV